MSEIVKTPRKPLTSDQKAAKNAKDRARRKEKKQLAGKTSRHSVVEAKRAVHARVVVAKIIENPSLSVSEAARAAGLPENVAQHPSLIINSSEWQKILDEKLPRGDLAEVHRGLLKASRIDHLVFTRDGEPSDEEIKVMLSEVNCTLRKIVHGDQARHVYFFAPDNKARNSALEMAYKLRGDFAGDKAAVAFSLAALARARDGGALPPGQTEASIDTPADDDRPRLPRGI